MKSKMLSVLISLVILFQGSASAVGNQIILGSVTKAGDAITMRGTTPAGSGAAVTLLAVKKGTEQILDNVFAIRETEADANGNFEITFKMDDRKADTYSNAEYAIYVDGEHAERAEPYDFYYVTAQRRADAVAQLEAAESIASMQSLLGADSIYRNAYDILGLSLDIYDALGEEEKKLAAEIFLSIGDYGANIAQNFETAVALSSVSYASTGTVAGELLNRYTQTVLNLQYSNDITYRSLSEAAQDWIDGRIAEGGNYKTVTQLNDKFKEAYVLYLANVSAYSELEPIIAGNRGILGLTDNINCNYYLNVSMAEKTLINKEIVKRVYGKSIYSKENFVEQFNAAVETIKGTQDKKSGSSSGGGGGGGSSIAVSGFMDMINQVPPVPVENSSPAFTDIQDVEWAKDSIEALAKKHVINGFEDGSFRPDAYVKREEFIKMVVNAFGLLDANAACDFGDVDKNDWYYPYIASMYAKGIANGTDDKSFGIGSYITREDMAVFLRRAAQYAQIKLEAVDNKIEFADNGDIKEYSAESVSVLQQAGIIGGVGNGRFSPAENSTRAQAAKVIYKVLQLPK